MDKQLTGYPSIDKPWLKYYSQKELDAQCPQKTVVSNIYEANRMSLDDTALLYFGKKFSYKALFDEVDKTAKAFLFYGVKHGDNIAICMPAVPEAIFTILALNMIGANANMLNATFTEEQLAARIAESHATILIILNELYDLVKNAIQKTEIKTVISCPSVNSMGALIKIVKRSKQAPETISWNDFICNGKGTELRVPKYEANLSVITVYSSGTTGASKGIQLTNESINWAIIENTPSTYGFERGKKYFLQIPIWFSTGIVTTGLVPLFYGVTLILEPLYDFPLFEKHIAKYKPNYIITAASLVEYLMRVDKKHELGRSWICLAIGGEYAPPKLEQRCNEWLKQCGNNHILRKGYGMCECGGSSVTSQIECNVLGTAGVPTPHVTVAAFDLSSGEELRYNQRGELRVITPCRMIGYYERPEETNTRLHKDNEGNIWVCTGDMGFVSEDGNITVCGRISDSYTNTANETVYLFDIERAILDVDGLKQCKVIATEKDKKTVLICHIVILEGFSEEIVLEGIKTQCSNMLVESYRPHLFHIYKDALPVAPSGKLNISQMKKDVDDLIKLEF